MLALVLVVVLAVEIAHGEPLAVARRCRDVGLGGAALAAPAVLIVLPYRRVRAELGLDRSAELMAVNPESFLASPTHVHRWLLSWLTDVDPTATASALLFPGCLVLGLAAAALWPGSPPVLTAEDVRRRRWRRAYALVGGVSLALYLPGPWTPWTVVGSWPGFDFVRVPSRFAIVTTLALGVLAGVGLDRIAASWRRGTATAAAAVVAIGLLAEYATMPFSGVPFRLPRPAVIEALATLPPTIVVAEVPIPRQARQGAFERFQSAAMLHSTTRWYRTIHGYSGLLPPQHVELSRLLTAFPDGGSLEALMAVGVTHVVVHRPEYPPETWPLVEARLRDTAALRVVAATADGLVLALALAPPP